MYKYEFHPKKNVQKNPVRDGILITMNTIIDEMSLKQIPLGMKFL
jgi:hypothetical protein